MINLSLFLLLSGKFIIPVVFGLLINLAEYLYHSFQSSGSVAEFQVPVQVVEYLLDGSCKVFDR